MDKKLLRPPVKIRIRPAPTGDVGIGVLEFVGSQLVDGARLRLAFPVWKRTRHDLECDRLLVFIDAVSAEPPARLSPTAKDL